MRTALCLFLLSTAVASAATLSLSTSGTPSSFGQSVFLTATVSPLDATGTVYFYDGPNVLGSAPINSGIAHLSTKLLPTGVRPILARYIGNSPTATASLTQTVNAASANNFVSAATLTVANSAQSSGVATADFNNDGKLDFVISVTSGLQIFLGNGDGSF